jgi:integrase
VKGWIVTRKASDGAKRYDARWRIAPGKVKGKTFTKKKAAENYLTTMVKRVQDGSYVEVQPALMGYVFDQWAKLELDVRLKEGSLKPSTGKSYRSMLNEHLRPAFGAYRSDRFTLAVVEEWRARVAVEIAAGTMASKTYVNLRNLLNAIARWARHPARRYLAHDPLDGLPKVRLPRAKKRPHFEPAQVAELLRVAAETPPDDTIIKVAVLSGLRRGEIFGLMWPDIDPGTGDGGRLHVRRSIYQGAITTPKTEDSDRVVDVPQRLLDELAVYKAMYPPIGEGFVFRQETGRPMDPDAWHRERLVPILERAELRLPRAGLHSLRHTYTSLLAAQGEDVRYIADQLGHSSPQLTQDIYQHVFSRVRVEAMRRLDAAIPYSSHVASQAETPGMGENITSEDANETES